MASDLPKAMENVSLSEGGAAPAVPETEDMSRRDALIANEQVIRALWDEAKVSEANAPEDASKPKFMCTFPYPYMNGRLHLGHGFSLTKAEFSARFNRLIGKNVLFPFGFHCTGMPIQAAANKIKREMALFGTPPDAAKVDAFKAEQAGKSRAKLSKKQAAKQGSGGAPKLQWEIMKILHFDDEDIPAFADPTHWLRHFPPLGKQDLQLFGASIDWRRSFLTTSLNPFYDSFIQWQFRYLTKEKYVKFGNRPTIFSELDGQICADHDRSCGEGVTPQQYTLIKIEVLDLGKKGLAELPSKVDLEGKKVFLVAATLRPETMYGQTNCFVLPDGQYGVFEVSDSEYFVCSHRSAKNMSYQGLSKELAKPVCVLDVKGSDLLGLPLKAPNVTAYERVYCLPLLTISMGKGTGVVTSVPSDAPDDYAALRDLQKKPEFRAKFGIEDYMVVPFEVIPILSVDEEHGKVVVDDFGVKAEVQLGNKSAVVLCEALDVASQNDTKKLKFIKDRCYKLGFNFGVMTCGKYKGMSVKDAKTKVRADMIAEGLAADYYEPENLVKSRSGDECVVSFEDQWFLDYGEETWRDIVLNHVNSENFKAFDEKVLNTYNVKLNWLGQWACSRQFGLGTRLPCDAERFVIESLSDSTIYMAYYTVCHYLQGGVLDGSATGPLNIKAEDMTDEVWDAIFLGGKKSIPENLPVAAEHIAQMRKEFEYWYPMDLRVSGKDLIGNHLIMSLYNHAAVWRDQPEKWPRSFYTNGHVLVDGDKMSKSAGTFLTVEEAAGKHSVDACRYALAIAGDGMDDANFEQTTAKSAVMKLTQQEHFIEKNLKAIEAGKLRSGDEALNFQDNVFINEINFLMQEGRAAYHAMHFKEATKNTFSLLINARKKYVFECESMGEQLHATAVLAYANAFVVSNSPICPFWAETMWQKFPQLRAGSESKFVVKAQWPEGPVDGSLRRNDQFCQKVTKKFKEAFVSGKKKRKGKADSDVVAEAFIQLEYSDWQIDVLDFLKNIYQSDPEMLNNPGAVTKPLKDHLAAKGLGKKQMGMPLGFATFVVKNEYPANGAAALESKCPIDQVGTLTENSAYLTRVLGIKEFHLNIIGSEDCFADAKKEISSAKPGAPTVKFV